MLDATPQEGVRYPLEYFSAPIEFAHRISSITGASFLDSLSRYTGLHGELTGAQFQEEPNEEVWSKFLSLIAGKSPQEVSHIAYTVYLEQAHSKFDPNWAPKGTTRFGALGVSTTQYNLDRNQVKLHFLPTRKGGSDLASSRLHERREDMKMLLGFVKNNHADIAYITSFTWLQNVPTYRALFPPSFLDRLTVMKDKFLGLWGQFVRWDGTANRRNYDAFIRNLHKAKTLDEAIDSISLQVLGAVGPIQEFYEFYGVK